MERSQKMRWIIVGGNSGKIGPKNMFLIFYLYTVRLPKAKAKLLFWISSEIRERYQGIVPPVNRSEEDMDACAKYHVAGDTPYIRYFVSHILQFQFYREMCLEAKQYIPESTEKPLHRCDFSEGEFKDAAGAKLRYLQLTNTSR